VPTIRLQRFLAQAGVASRRHAEELITQGRVKVNGRVVTELGTKVDPAEDKVVLAGRRVRVEDLCYLLMNKPRGTVTTLSDPEGRPTVKELLPRNQTERVFPVGRLDFNTEGALLFTNDGDLMHALLHPSHKVAKVYHAKLRGKVPPERIERLRRGVPLPSGRTQPAEAFVLGETETNTWIELLLTEGRTHQVKEMAEAIGHPVVKLMRVSFAGLTLEGLRPGQTRPLTTAEVEELRKLAGAGSLSKAKRRRRG
jgi:23S rRNA pseudouridine2605 synthase